MLCYVWISLFVFFFFFKQKTAYEMRISDWSSDVCSSDLPGVQGDIGIDALPLDVVRKADDRRLGHQIVQHQRAFNLGGAHAVPRHVDDVIDPPGDQPIAVGVAPAAVAGEIFALRSEERRVGKEWGSKSRYRWPRYH